MVWQYDLYGDQSVWEIYYINSIDEGASWNSLIRLTYTESLCAWPRIAVTGMYEHVVWHGKITGHDEIYYKRNPNFNDTTSPIITNIYPTGTDVSVNTKVNITFSEPMNQTSVENAFTITPIVIGDIGWDGGTMVFTPVSNLSYDTIYNVTVTTSAGGIAGNHLQSNYSWEFKTEKEPDTVPPVITNVQANHTTQEVEEYVNITCIVIDNVEVNIVKVNITGPAGFTSVNISMIRITDTNDYYYNASYSFEGTYDYYIWVNDTSDNAETSATYQFQITSAPDTEKPQISNILDSPDPQTSGSYVNITCTVTDNVEVNIVKVNITGPAGFTSVNISMIRITDTNDY
ncbi:MAG: Ig-like domain-containing protein, partial [Thermoplasmatales archaeon]|nr:Ig-like domain-containing protein [Thermoplasmatales archaeon]